jgi:hypothetical protein
MVLQVSANKYTSKILPITINHLPTSLAISDQSTSLVKLAKVSRLSEVGLIVSVFASYSQLDPQGHECSKQFGLFLHITQVSPTTTPSLHITHYHVYVIMMKLIRCWYLYIGNDGWLFNKMLYRRVHIHEQSRCHKYTSLHLQSLCNDG